MQGCLRAHDVQYGLTADTGGHIRYVLELAAATGARPEVTRVEIATRSFREPGFDPIHAQPRERLDGNCDIIRFASNRTGYVAKEQLGAESRSYSAALVRYLRRLPVLPDIVHAHYADAGQIALWLKQELGLPFVFTAHSLGRLKQVSGAGKACKAVRNDVITDALRRRIQTEEAVLAGASLVIASSRDEAEQQLGLYANHDSRRTCVIAPGSSLDDTAPAPALARIDGILRALLHKPDKPPILALARPVRRKNLATLLQAYAADSQLRERANLVLFTGSRQSRNRESSENAAVRQELHGLIERCGLHGHVALPASHAPGDVSAIYRWAARRRGVFANVAYSEPFGLTLIEAARCGLPLVATNRGGPCNIVGEHGSGVLVDPHDEAAIGNALCRLLANRDLWSQCATAAMQSAAHFDWHRHTATYLQQLRTLLERERAVSWRRRSTA
ncbi:MAG TPA: glycosyltransferase [Salinisphaeraceae bacterium]|nr:glycosyltransferase [Salinisphaeraceae bacterium]